MNIWEKLILCAFVVTMIFAATVAGTALWETYARSKPTVTYGNVAPLLSGQSVAMEANVPFDEQDGITLRASGGESDHEPGAFQFVVNGDGWIELEMVGLKEEMKRRGLE